MKSSSSYASKVLKFQKKYAKPITKIEEKVLRRDHDSSISSESLGNSVGIAGSKSMSCSNVTRGIPHLKDSARNAFSSLGHVITQASEGNDESSNSSVRPGNTSISKQFTDVREDQRCITNDIKTKSIKSEIISLSDEDHNFTQFKEIKNEYIVKRDENKTLVNKSDNEWHEFHGDLPEKNNFVIVSSDKTECDVSEILESSETNEKQVSGSRVQMNLHLNFNEDCDEITDMSKNSISVPSLENVGSTPNLPLHILNFEDLISIEEQETSVEELGDNLSVKSKVDHCSEVSEHHSKATSSCMEDKYFRGSQNSDSKEANTISKVVSAIEYPHESQANEENTEISTIKEEIEEVEEEIESIFSESCDELSDQLLTHLENSEGSLEIGTKEGTVSSVKKKENKSPSESVNLSSEECFEENIADQYTSANKKVALVVTENQSREIHEVEKVRNHNCESSMKSCTTKNENYSDEVLKVLSDKYSKMCRETEKPSSECIKHDTKVHYKRDNNLDKYSQSIKKNQYVSKPKLRHASAQTESFLFIHDNTKNYRETKKSEEQAEHKMKKYYKKEKYFNKSYKTVQNHEEVPPTKVHHTLAQTENVLLFKNDEFEKKMEAIMKSSFDSMMKVNTSISDLNDVFTAQSSDSASASSSPLERGFNCALRQQVELTKHFIEAEYNMYLVCVSTIKELSATYKPATLHYAKKIQKKKREKLRTERN